MGTPRFERGSQACFRESCAYHFFSFSSPTPGLLEAHILPDCTEYVSFILRPRTTLKEEELFIKVSS